MFHAIDGARCRIALEMYTVADDETGREFRAHLIAAARRGVEVKVLVDALGSWSLSGSFWDELVAGGGQVRWFRPFKRGMFLFRNHRKLLLVDDSIAFIGGFNIADEYYRGSAGEPPWRDNALELTGAETARLRRSFSRMWARAESLFRRMVFRLRREQDGKAAMGRNVRFLESGPEDLMHPVRRVYRRMVRQAVKNIDLAMGYFYPHGGLLRALKRAVKRGVRVRLLFTQKSDVPVAQWAARGLYGRLLRAGVEVWEYTPAMLHAKLAVIDDRVIAGSANLDIRSGRINYELVAIVADSELAARARRDFEEDLTQSVRISLDDWKRRSMIKKMKERFSYCLLARADIFFAKAELARRMR